MKNGSYRFLRTEIDALTYESFESTLDQWLEDKDGPSHHVACLNAYCVTLALKNDRLARIYHRAHVRGADGVPFVKWIRMMTGWECDRFCAPDLINYLSARSADKGYTFYLYGGDPEVAEAMQRDMETRFPHISIVGRYSPSFRPLTEEEDRVICDEINRLKPDIVCVGLGTPKQDYWIDEHLESIRGSVLIASGATFDFFGGRVGYAPEVIRRSGFEWLYRLLGKDFKRLFYRYTVLNCVFLGNFALQVTRLRRFSPPGPETGPTK